MRIVCLATPVEDADRFAQAQVHFADVGLGHIDYFHGLHQRQSGLVTTHDYMVDRGPGSKEEGIPYQIGPHPTNIWVGHYFLWQALKLSGDDAWLVLETDAKFPAGADANALITTAVDEMRDLDPNYDLLYIGSCACAGQHRVNRRLYRDAVGPRAIATVFGNSPQCNHAYVVRAKAVPIFETTLRKVWAPIDVQQTAECFEYGSPLPRSQPFTRPSRRLAAYVVLPRIADQWNTYIPP